MSMSFAVRARLLPLATLLALAGPAVAADPADPWEGLNRGVFVFNEQLDNYVAKPAAKVYQKVVPRPVDNAVSRFFNNLTSPLTLVNQLLQGKPADAAATTSRLIFNSTLGLGGLFDIAEKMGVPRKKEDFGQTLAVWGVGAGPYVMLPVLGPSTVRDFFGRAADGLADPRAHMNAEAAYGLAALDLLDTRADLLSAEKVIEGDRYTFIREFYLQQRAFAIADGKIEKDEFLDEDFDDEDEPGSAAE
ncbi:VacJ family lipoprotein [Amnimonas aquatica]|mgnify:CR=1 FL=1|nr:VacJ family lipoprotein [Amnimonas aquatica]